jgi:hypothetical protein
MCIQISNTTQMSLNEGAATAGLVMIENTHSTDFESVLRLRIPRVSI